MIGTWEILESGKGGGVGRKIPLTADWRKNRDEPRTSQGVTGDPFHPQGLAQPLFRNFPQAALASYSSLERDLPCHRVWTHVRSDKSRDARTPEEGPVRGLQVKVVPCKVKSKVKRPEPKARWPSSLWGLSIWQQLPL